ncbi:MAG: S-layer homology domain-containing protein [Clostridiaceae bacterium]|nr:S-layer homology domain-containing protein [Clostridiaceae bacterium]
MKKRILRLTAVCLIIAVLLFSQVFAVYAGWGDPIICVKKELENGRYSFKVQRVKDASTGELNNSTDITFTYKIQCESDAYEVLKVVEGSSGIPAGKNDITVDVADLVEEMRVELPKYKSITLLCTLKNVKGASLGTIDQIILNNTTDVSEEDIKAWLEAFGEMFENTEEKSGKADISDDGAGTLQTEPQAFKGASSWAVPELEKAAGYGFITDRIKDNMSAPITREEFAEVAVKLYEKYTGKQAVTGDMSVFADTTNPEIFKAYNLKIVNGTDMAKKLFSPKDSSNRQQVAVMLFRTVNTMYPNADFGTSGVGRFADEKDIASWAVEAVRFMNKNGFLKGSDNKIDPNGICTREMAVLIATRVYEKY